MKPLYQTELGAAYFAQAEDFLASAPGRRLRERVQLVFTSPPFPLNRKKKYDNKVGDEYKQWFSDFAVSLSRLLTPTGSIVIEMGNAWVPGAPVMSTLPVESLLAFRAAAKLHLCQEFIWYNPARLPTPAQWVTIERVRVKDAFTRFWWLSTTPYPKADNRRVLKPYSASMKKLLRTGRYNAGQRPSEHVIGAKSFLRANPGAIPPNVLSPPPEPEDLLVFGNTAVSGYQLYCERHGFEPHPARMPRQLAEFFVNLCTEPGDLVFDPFSGSNTTGAAAERLGRRWLSVEAREGYALSGRFHFEGGTPGGPEQLQLLRTH